MKAKLFIFAALFGALFILQSCDKDEDINIPPAQNTVIVEEKLQFSKVVYVQLDTLLLDCTDCSFDFTLSKTINVEQNKVLKIEGISWSYSQSFQSVFNGVYFNGLQINEVDETHIQFPIWVPAGSYSFEIKLAGSFASFDSRHITATLSGIEYDITP